MAADFSPTVLGTVSPIDQKNQNWATSSKTKFTGDGITGITITTPYSNYYCLICKIEVYVGDVLWKTLTCQGGNTFYGACDYIALWKGDDDRGFPSSIDLDLSATKKYYGGNPWGQTTVTTDNPEIEFTSSGDKAISLKIWRVVQSGGTVPDHRSSVLSSCTVVTTGSAGTLSVLAPAVSGLTLSGGRRSFYSGEGFSHSGLTVNENYKYRVDSSVTAYSAQTLNYSVSDPSSQFQYARENGIAYATITVTASGKTAYYGISIYGVLSYTQPSAQSIRGGTVFRRGEAYTIANSTVTYSDETTGSITPTVSSLSTEQPTAAATINAQGQAVLVPTATANVSLSVPQAGTSYTWESKYRVVPLYKLTLDSSSVKKSFLMNETFTYAGLGVTAHYGYANKNDEDIGGTRPIALDAQGLSVAFPAKAVGPNQSVTVTYNDGYDTASSTYLINVDGLSEMAVDISYYGQRLRVPKNGTLAYGNAVVKVRRYENGVLSNWTSSDVPPVSVGALDTSTTGDKEVTFSVSENGATVSTQVPVTVYGIASISVSNYPSGTMYYEGTNYPTVDVSKFRVIATTSDGVQIPLSYNAVNDGYEVVIGGVLQTNDVITVSSDMTLIVRSKSEPGVSQSISLDIQEQGAVENAPLSISGNVVYVSAGERIDLSGFTVMQLMNTGSGQQYVQIHDYSCVISGKDGLVFDSTDTAGQYYDLVFSKSPSSPTTYQNSVYLDGVRSIADVSVSKQIYEIGEAFDPSTVTCTVNYYHSPTRTGQAFRTGVDSCDPITFTAAQANTGSGANVGKVSVPLTLYGQSVTVDVYVRKVVSIAKTAAGNVRYDIHDQLSDGFGFTKTYNYAIGGVTTYAIPASDMGFSFSGAGTGCSASDLIPLKSTDVIGVTPSYTENGITVYGTPFDIYVKRIKNVTLVDSDAIAVTAIHMDKGDTLDLSPYRLHVEFNDATVSNVQLGDSATAATPADGAIITDKVANAKVPYTYVRGDTVNATYTIHVHYVSAITTNLAEIVESEYYVGDTLNLLFVTASRTVSSTDEGESGYPKSESFEPSFTLNGMGIGTTYRFDVAGDYTLSFSDSGIVKSSSFQVLPVTLSSIAVEKSSAFKDLGDYVEGQTLNLTGLSVTKTYNSGSEDTLQWNDPTVLIVDENGDSFRKDREIALSDDGTELFVKIEENDVVKYASIGTLAVGENELDSIGIAQTSTHKTSFTYGDTFSIDGLIVVANFTNGSSSVVQPSAMAVSGVARNHEFNPTDDPTFGTTAITVSYTHGEVTKTASYNIDVTKPVLSSVTTNATSDAVVTQFTDGDVYSDAGLIVTGVFANGWRHTIPSTDWSTNAATVLNINQQTGEIQMTGDYGAKTITVTAGNPYDPNQNAVTATYTVDVMTSGAIVSAMLMFDGDVDYANYTVGDVFDAKGVYFRVTDIDGGETDVRTFSTNPAKGTLLRSARRMEITCTYVKGTFTHTATYKIVVSVPNVVSFAETNDYLIAVGTADGGLFESITHEEQTITLGKTYDSLGNPTGEFYPLFHEDRVQRDANPAHANTYGYNVYTGNDAESDCIGYVDLGVTAGDGTVVRQAHVILFDDPLNPIDGQGNIEVKFPHYVTGLADRINKCRFGIVYNNRLFVAGNPDFRNCDWHSGAVNVSQTEDYDRNADLDFTYFSDLDYCYYGTDDTAIVGYDIYRDGDLLVVKEGSRYQATLYRRSYKLIAAQSYDGNELDGSLAEEAFPMFDVNANGGVGGLSNRSILSFVGETLILTKDGFKAIANKENVYNSAKYSFDVSSYINPRISKEDLGNAFAFAFKEKLLLKTDGGVYVGYNELRNENGEYEWYYLCDLPADVFFEHDGELFFANDEGGVYRFPDRLYSYYDMDRTFLGEGGTLLEIDGENDRIIASNAYADEIKEGRAFHLLTSFNLAGVDVRTQVHATLGTFVNANYRKNIIETGGIFDDTLYNGYIDPETDEIVVCKRGSDGNVDELATLAIRDSFYDGRKVRFDMLQPEGQDSLAVYEDYTLSKTGDVRVTPAAVVDLYKVLDKNGNAVNLGSVSVARMCFVVNDLAVTYIQNVQPYGSDGAKSFNLLGDHSQTLDLVYYNNQNGYYYSGVVTAENKVRSFYVTAPYSMGSISSLKTVWAWVIANDTNLASYMDVGYISSRKQGGFETIVKSSPASRKLKFEGFDFSRVSFLNDSLPHVYTRYRTLPSVSFIRFVFKNEEDTNIALTALDVIYTVSGLSKGVK